MPDLPTFESFRRYAYGVARNWARLTGIDYDDFRIVTEDALLRALESMDPSYGARCRGYVARIIKREASRYAAQHRARKLREEKYAQNEEPPYTTMRDVENMIDAERILELARELLSAREMYVLLSLIYVPGSTHATLGHQLRLSRQGITQIHRRAIAKIRDYLED